MSLAEAAVSLGVHYQTAYRWVRRGVLPAVKVAGSYEIDTGDLEALRRDRRTPEPPPQRRQVRSFGRFADRLLADLVVGDEAGVRELFADLVEGGVSLSEVCDQVLSPALRAIGERWSRGELSIAVEHRASAICERALARWAPHPPGRPRGVAVVCSPTSEGHELPGLMAATVLRGLRWRVHHLGVGVPADSIERLVADEGADLVVVSATLPETLGDARELVGRLRSPGRRVLLGRPGLTMSDLAAAVSASEPGPAAPAGGSSEGAERRLPSSPAGPSSPALQGDPAGPSSPALQSSPAGPINGADRPDPGSAPAWGPG